MYREAAHAVEVPRKLFDGVVVNIKDFELGVSHRNNYVDIVFSSPGTDRSHPHPINPEADESNTMASIYPLFYPLSSSPLLVVDVLYISWLRV